jgi:uncharacterized membrane protein YdjX (TVP38/TMEM64 family)
MPRAARRILSLALLLLLAAAIALPVVVWHRELWAILSTREHLQEWLAGWGDKAKLVYVALQVFQVVIFMVPGELIQVAGGYFFGAAMGSLLATVGAVVGATICFFLGRLLGRPFLSAFVSADRVAKVEKLIESPRGTTTLFLLYLIPGIPKDVLGYVAGVSPLRYVPFIAVSTLGRLPGLVGSAVIGSSAASQRWVLFGIVAAAAVILFGAGLLLRPRVQTWLERLGDRKKPGGSPRGGTPPTGTLDPGSPPGGSPPTRS